MTIKEAEKVIMILKEADGGCSRCVRSLIKDFKKSFPGILTDKRILEIVANDFIEEDDLN